MLGVLQSPQPPPTEIILTALLNEITIVPDSFVLILDDYHNIDSSQVDDAVSFLLEHLSPHMHLVIATREDPRLGLARLRASGQLTELRATDLRFSSSEAAEFLIQVMGLNLSTEEVTSLEARTEGWIAGLQLAALSMRGREDVPGFIRAFAGDNRYIVDYLVEEVLQHRPEHVRSFLLQTSILDRLSDTLCNAVTGREDGKEILEGLEHGNLFVVPLDDKRQWYRYHHLFADVLRAHLMEEQPNQIPTLHRWASEWYERNGLPSDAIRHALAAEDFERASGLVELAWRAMNKNAQSARWLVWAQTLPEELIRASPVLSVGYAWALLDTGDLEAVDEWLRNAERWLETIRDTANGNKTSPAEMVVVDEDEFLALPATIAAARAYLAQALGDVPGTVKYARRAIDLLPEDDFFGRAIPTMILGLAYWSSGELEAAHESIVDGLAGMRKAGNQTAGIVGASLLAEIRIAQGRLHDAERTYGQALQLVADQAEPVLPGMAELYVGLGELHLERGELESAAQHLLRSEELGELAVSPGNEFRLFAAMARIKEALGDMDGAFKLLDESERLYYMTPVPDVRPVSALRARIWINQGGLAEAQDWVSERGLMIDDDLSYLCEFEHVTLARVLIARYKSDRVERSIHEAIGLLKRLLQAAEEGGRTGSVIEILILQALAREVQDDTPSALLSLDRTLTLAEPEGYVRIFVDEGQPMAELLLEAEKHGIAPNYVGQLQAAFGKAESTMPVDQHLIEPLSKRELEVLRLLGTELSGPEIARVLMVSTNTMRTHTKNIYSKLGVHNRRAAVRRAEELDLL